MSCSGLIATSASNVGLALLDQLAAKGFGDDAALVEVGHKLPRNLQRIKRHTEALVCSFMKHCILDYRHLPHSSCKHNAIYVTKVGYQGTGYNARAGMSELLRAAES